MLENWRHAAPEVLIGGAQEGVAPSQMWGFWSVTRENLEILHATWWRFD